MLKYYTKHTWGIGEPITQGNINHIEEGIEDISNNTSEINSNVAGIDSRLTTAETTLRTTSGVADQAARDAVAAMQATENGTEAWREVSQALITDPSTHQITKHLADRIKDNADAAAAANTYADTVFRLVDAATKVGTITENGSQVTASSLAKKIADMDLKIALASQLAQGTSTIVADNDIVARLNKLDSNEDLSRTPYAMTVPTIITELKGARGKNQIGTDNANLDERLDFIDGGGNAPSRTLPDIITEINGAHRSGISNDTLDKRLDDIDNTGTAQSPTHLYRITQLETEMSDARSNEVSLDARLDGIDVAVSQKVPQSDIYKGLDYQGDDNKVLQALQGKLLKDEIDNINGKIGGSYTSLNTVDAAINSLDERLDMIDGGTILSGTDLATRVTNIENEIDAANGEGTLDNRFDTIEGRLDDIDSGDNAMISNIATNLINAQSDIATINNTIGTGFNTTTDTVANKIAAAIETAAADATSKANAASAAAEAAAKTYTDTGLAEKADQTEVDELKEKDTVILTDVVFINGAPVISDPSTDCDYLLQQEYDDKYYYWRYFGAEEGWQLISGAGSGSGNSNAEDYESRAAFEADGKELNKDYYVLEDDGIRHHYRYLSIEPNAQPIEIGVLKSNIKNYQIATSTLVEGEGSNEEINQYLDLYAFDFGTQINSDDIDYDDDASYRLAHVLLPKGGGGDTDSTGYKIYAKLRGDQTQRISLSEATTNGINLKFAYTCYSYSQEDGYQYKSVAYTLTKNDGTVIDSSNGEIVGHLEVKDENDPTSYTNINSYNINIQGLENQCEVNKTTSFTLTLHSPDDETIRDKNLTVYITVVDLSLTSTFSDQQTYSISNNLIIPYTFVGINETPTFIVLLDNNPITPTISANNITIRSQQLAGLSGVHNLSIKASQNVSGSTLYSNTLNYQLGLTDGTGTEIMLFSGESLEEKVVEQYQNLKLPYYLYVPASLNDGIAAVSFEARRVTSNWQDMVPPQIVEELYYPTENLTTGSYTYNFRLHDVVADIEYYIITITCSNQQLIFKIKVNKSADQINIKTENLIFDFKPERYNNNTANIEERLWSYPGNGVTYRMRIPEGAHFDWRTGGWIKTGEEEVPCFCVKAGSRVEFIQENNTTHAISPLTLFWNNMEQMGGSNFKCTFKIDNVKTPNAPFLTSLDTETNTITNYGKTLLASAQDIEDDESLLENYLNVKYIYTKTLNGTKVIKEAIGTTVLGNEPFSNQLTQELRAAAETSAANKNVKKIKQYISNIYDIANQATNQEHRAYLLKVLAGKANDAELDYSTIKDEITTYLQVLANAESIYARLTNEGDDSSTITYAYRQAEPVNFDAMLNGFVVEGKAGKDGIIAMIQFTFESTIKTGGGFDQTVSSTPISTNSFAKTGTFLVTVTDTRNNNIKLYEVEMLDEAGNGTYTEIVDIKDASNKETRAYGLELNALGSNIYLPSGVVSYAHSEGDIIEFEYNINPEISGRVNSSIIIYEDGVPSAAKLYTSRNNTFEQINPGSLIIGSDECDVYIYKMRLYDKALNNADILANFYADGLTTDEMIDRYNRNKNLVKAQTITPQLIAEECPDLRVIMIEAPTLTGGKTSFIKNTKVRCIYKNGRPEDNWVALNAYHAGQGTSSDNYGASGRNLDIIFGFNGADTVIIPKPQKNNYTFDPTYKSILIKGLDEDNTNDILTAEEYEAAGYTVEYNGTGKVTLTDTSIPNNWFNIKVNVASSENTNNAYLQKRFDRYLKDIYLTPAQKRDNRIKNDMEFFNCVIFIKETGTASEFTSDNSILAEDRPWHFYGIGNIGDSKKTDSTRVNIPGDPNEFAIEISDNGLKLSGFCSGVFYISEQSKTRSQTSRGQVNGNADLSEAFTAQTIHVCESNEYSVNNNTYSFTITPDTTVMYLVPIVGENFTYYRRFMYISSSWTEVGEPITFDRTSYGIKYPISQAEWNNELNTYYNALYDTDSGKGWDKSFEFRYDLTTKDGETVARNDTEAALNAQRQKANKLRFADLYSWIVTTSNSDFKNHLDDWFIKESPLYWYLFTERYTMIDSRAKNTFYHCGKVYITEDEATGTNISTLEAALNTALAGDDQIAIENAQTAYNVAVFMHEHADCFIIDNTLADQYHNNGYRFDLWDYDNDTALGINNNGQMVFSAGLEDIDKDVSGWIYNEAESVIWRRIRENMYAELGALYVQLKGQCFNAENLIQEFDNMQNQFPEELWRLDFERKYYRPFIELGETTYLNDMANGRKRYQRRQFERNMAIYINSKYQRNGSYNENDIISFRPQFTWTEGRDTRIIIKPYSTMYINFALGNYDNTGDVTLDTTLSTRINRGETYTINAADYIHDFNNIQCIIYNASRIMELDGLGNFECKQFILGAAKKLSVLKLGSTDYPNRSMADVNNMGLSDGLPLLEELDLTNIQFGTAPDTFALDNFPLLKKLNATGCNIRSFTFKDGGMLERVIFHAALTKIEFNNLYNLVDTYDNGELVSAVTLTGTVNLISYNSINSYSNSYQIVQNMLNNAGLNRITQLKLNDIDWAIGNIDELDPLVELQDKLQSNMYLAGTIHIMGNWSTVEINEYHSIWPSIIFDPQGQQIIKHEVIYQHNGYYLEDGTYIQPSELKTVYVENGKSAPDIYATGEIDLPTQPNSIRETYRFGSWQGVYYIPYSGWANAENPTVPLTGAPRVEDRLVLQTYFTPTTRTYPIKWYLYEDEDETKRKLIKTSDPVEYGGGENQEAPTVKDIHAKGYSTATVKINNNNTATYSIFKGWRELPTKIHPHAADTSFNIYADWEEGKDVPLSEMFSDNILSNLTPEQLLVLSAMNGNQKDALGISSKLRKGFTTMEYTLGYDSIKEGISLINRPYKADLDRRILANGLITDVQPFNSTNDAFTIAIDYSFNPEFDYDHGGDPNRNSPTVGVLASCYEQNLTTNTAGGFVLYYNLNSSAGTIGPRLGFGDIFKTDATAKAQSIALGNTITAKYRNMVVLRHPAGSNELYIYSGLSSNADNNSLPEQVEVQRITWTNGNTNAYLRFGCLTDITKFENDSNYTTLRDIVDYGGGTIYWAKYWNEDLGFGECERLAAWPHEKMTYVLTNLTSEPTKNERANSTAIAPIPSIYLTSLTASVHGQIEQSGTNSISNFSWDNSVARTIANDRLYLGLPIKLQAILCKSAVQSIEMYKQENMQYAFNSNPISTRDYIYLPSYSNISTDEGNGADIYNLEENVALKPFDQVTTANVEVYTYDAVHSNWVSSTPKNYYQYLNIRFAIKPIQYSNYDSGSEKLRIFVEDQYNRIQTSISTAISTLRPGDIFIDSDGQAYMYVTSTDQDNLGLCTSSIGRLIDQNGGWIPSYSYWLRSVDHGSNTTRCGFLMIKTSGYVIEEASLNKLSANLCYSMAI